MGFYPRKLERYSIFGTTVVSPSNGVVLRTVDGLPDLPPGQMDRTNAAGNHIVIRLDGVDVNLLLAHLKNGSVSVNIGDRVSTGQPIGKVGNSGNTTEPHLHIHAQTQVTRDGKTEWVGVPIRFGSRWLVRNSLVRA
jgi:murein DD-endopeptidase MepM/ murein hydrolase activator NlpD